MHSRPAQPAVESYLKINFKVIVHSSYKTEDYYWGVEPNAACFQVLQFMPPVRRLKLLDLGCGEGKDAVFFARNGYEVTALDVSDAGLRKTQQLADKAGVQIHIVKADILDYRLDTYYDVVFSSGVLHYIKPEHRSDIFDNYKRFTRPNGIHVLNVFVDKPFIAPPPEKEPYAFPWHSGELLTHYRDWRIQDSAEIIFDCCSSGIPHRHAMTTLVAQKVSPSSLAAAADSLQK
ncbi:class I SAM-dependent methyltransferase [Paenibacillus lemnae]|uniref:Methyltransferase domain-containing protein n=1 Tax=Paenibacillus lemnae TaxID=1330551 RepID=A0A848M6A8_PAELE|nr:class I SAM-dependent methyltransferase [Paenibacillus lemnae]NMO95134.1 methyltransferase domain-containing protein [Paenibacillus lemnae]